MKKNNPIYLASRNTVALLLGLVMLAACATQPTSANRSMGSGLTFATPESVGVDSDRLDRLTQAMQGFVDDGRLAGVVTAAARDGKIIHFESVGQRDIAAGSPMTDDALFRIYSMTKPITGLR
jgi:CubicO group peptidase (beta-lactamase class C family)